MPRRLTGYQPHYFPRLHYYARILNADIFTISDYVQYVRKHAFPGPDGTTIRGVSYQAHTPIKTRDGRTLLDVPVRRGDSQMINEAPVDYATPWNEKHLKSIEINYRRAPRFSAVFPMVEAILMKRHATLAQLTIASTLAPLMILLEIDDGAGDPERLTEQVNARLPHPAFRIGRIEKLSATSVLPPDKAAGRDADTWIIDTCRQFGAREYYFGGTGASAYMRFESYEEAGITLIQQDWKPVAYSQQHAQEFIPNLSILDLLFNVPPERARGILRTPDQ